MTNTQKHAQRELDILAATVTDAAVTPFAKEILAICEAFGQSGQSGGSAPFTASAISQAVKKLMLHDPICDVTGHQSEWSETISPDSKVLQNTRCSALFKNPDGKCHYLDAIIWKGEEEWDTFSGSVYIDAKSLDLISSRQFVRFPFKPKTFYIDVVRVSVTKEGAEARNLYYIEGDEGCYYSVLKDPRQLDKVFKYYEKG